jgi:hypothetical protein
MPSSYQISTTDVEGVGEKCGSSLAVVDNILFYKSRTGVCVYDGSLPSNIGGVLGRKVCTGAVGGDGDGKYYVYIGEDEGSGLYCYDTASGIWTKESSRAITHMEQHHGILYCTDGSNVFTVNGFEKQNKLSSEDDFDWYAETGDIGTEADNKKYLSRILVRMKLDPKAVMRIRIAYDSSGDFETVYEAEGTSMRVYDAYVRTRRCDHFRLRFEGHGGCEIYSITKYSSYGSTR